MVLRLVEPASGALLWLECNASELLPPCEVLGGALPALAHKSPGARGGPRAHRRVTALRLKSKP